MNAVAIWALVLAGEPSPTVAIEWRAPTSCPQREDIAAGVAALLPEITIAEPGAPTSLLVDGRIDLDGSERWAVTLRFEGERGVDERTFSGSDCATLGEAAVLVIAVTVDPLATAETIDLDAAPHQPTPEPRPEPRPEPEPEPEPPPEPEPLPQPEPKPKPEPSPDPDSSPPVRAAISRSGDARGSPDSVRASLGALGGFGYGPLTLGQGALGFDVGALGPHWRASARALWLPPRTQSTAGAQARYDGFAGSLRGCGVPTIAGASLEFPVCLGVEAGFVRGRGSGATPNARSSLAPYVGALVTGGLRWALRPRVAISVDADLLVPLVRGGFTIGGGVVQEFSPVGVRGLAGLEIRLP